jgi:hypothetical protein
VRRHHDDAQDKEDNRGKAHQDINRILNLFGPVRDKLDEVKVKDTDEAPVQRTDHDDVEKDIKKDDQRGIFVGRHFLGFYFCKKKIKKIHVASFSA